MFQNGCRFSFLSTHLGTDPGTHGADSFAPRGMDLWFHYRTKFRTSRTTWSDIVRTCAALSSDEESYSPLHRAEGGFMCVSAPGFVSTELAQSVSGDPSCRKAIRFVIHYSRPPVCVARNWPSRHLSFAGAQDNLEIFPDGAHIQLLFEGEGCPSWTKEEMDSLSARIGSLLGWHALQSPGCAC